MVSRLIEYKKYHSLYVNYNHLAKQLKKAMEKIGDLQVEIMKLNQRLRAKEGK